jgi:excisionase family DNA binding protein
VSSRTPSKQAVPGLEATTSLIGAVRQADGQPSPSFMTSSEVADFLRFSTKTIQRLVQSGRLKAYRLCGAGPRRFRRQDVERLLEVETTSEAPVSINQINAFITSQIRG